MRVRVPLGRRSTIGYVLRRVATPDPTLKLRPVERLLDAAAVLPKDLLELATFTAEYYLAPIGEVLRAMLPSDLAAWGERRVWLTSAGAIAPARDPVERAIVEALLGAGRLGGLPALAIDELPQRSAAGVEGVWRPTAGGEDALSPPSSRTGDPTGCSRAARSPAGRGSSSSKAPGRPARSRPARAGCVWRAGWKLGVLRQFTQAEHLSLERPLRSRADGSRSSSARTDGGGLRAHRCRAAHRIVPLDGMWLGQDRAPRAVESTLAGRAQLGAGDRSAQPGAGSRAPFRRPAGAATGWAAERRRGSGSVVARRRSFRSALGGLRALPKVGLRWWTRHDVQQDSSPRHHGRDRTVRARS
jgi:hypothetical protein